MLCTLLPTPHAVPDKAAPVQAGGEVDGPRNIGMAQQMYLSKDTVL